MPNYFRFNFQFQKEVQKIRIHIEQWFMNKDFEPIKNLDNSSDIETTLLPWIIALKLIESITSDSKKL